jgi:predicted nucleic acid-binding protein
VIPDLAYTEVANALVVQQRAGLGADGVALLLEQLLDLPLVVVGAGAIVEEAVVAAVARDLSLYDACYAVLADAPNTVLVTADRKLAGATGQSVLLTEF